MTFFFITHQHKKQETKLLFSTRTSPSLFVLFISSYFNLIALVTGLLSRILSTGFNIDPSSTNTIWYKIRVFSYFSAVTTSLTCIFFASIGRYESSPIYQRWNRSKIFKPVRSGRSKKLFRPLKTNRFVRSFTIG